MSAGFASRAESRPFIGRRQIFCHLTAFGCQKQYDNEGGDSSDKK